MNTVVPKILKQERLKQSNQASEWESSARRNVKREYMYM